MVGLEINIRRAVSGDADVVSHLSKITFEDTFKGTCTDDDMREFVESNFNLPQVLKELDNNEDFYFIAYVDEKPSGYFRLREDKSYVEKIDKYKAIELKRIYVLKEYHSKKVGAMLMNFALDFAAKKKYELMWLGVWEHNEKAKSFYQKFGFENSGVTHDFPIGKTPQTDYWFFRFI